MKNCLLAILVLFFISCGSDDNNENCLTKDYTEDNDQEIQNYLESNNLEAEKTNSGLYYIVEEQGIGAQPSSSSRVRVNYKGYFLNGNVFDQNNDITFGLGQVIPGWTEGFTYFKEGGSGKLLIPSNLAYGPCKYSTIPGGSVLIFDIELLEVIE
ncbi:FKBP-type peptidyl-prolyl cis-trans isomerase [Zunongwangia sp. HRR-M8]|uniref:FKBP-type peptidyl-prolyl cis-trans isomerase n=1 Tax=Zunongwangia sp. HRR-M8 TaxID=3015170 RepID=UPI0022DCE8D8|nr:FKBP-type peptidyl-prolyl cis-trans isomerase [Zunongwangia sp. HRR-M8]WBL22763.1 FKBP-type peptidyl-prolyl cis-trans isomerase [Zunongwangia sp. HRR-M8]